MTLIYSICQKLVQAQVQQFIANWQRANLSERSACQQHFLDLCELLDQPKPAAADLDGAWYTFERGVRTTEDTGGWADVWMRNHFGWEYRSPYAKSNPCDWCGSVPKNGINRSAETLASSLGSSL